MGVVCDPESMNMAHLQGYRVGPAVLTTSFPHVHYRVGIRQSLLVADGCYASTVEYAVWDRFGAFADDAQV